MSGVIERRILYFEKDNVDQLDEVVAVVKRVVDEEKIRYVIVASGTGRSGLRFAEALKDRDVKLVIVTSPATSPFTRLPDFSENIRKLKEIGIPLVQGPYMFDSIPESYAREKGMGWGSTVSSIIANTLRLFCQGIQVAPTVTVPAVEAGYVPEGVEAAVVAGTKGTINTACVVRASSAYNFFNDKKGFCFKEILCMPREKYIYPPGWTEEKEVKEYLQKSLGKEEFP